MPRNAFSALASLVILVFSAASALAAPSPEAATPHQAAMERLSPLVGHYEVTGQRYTPEGPTPLAETQASVEPILNGFGLMEVSQSDMGLAEPVSIRTTFSYDPYRKIYRITAFDDTFGVLDVYEGGFISEHILSVTNLRSDTYFPIDEQGTRGHFQLRWDLSDKNKKFDVLMSTDGGASWLPFYEMIYTPVEKPIADDAAFDE